MQCGCCTKEIENEYLHVLAVEPNHFNYCCKDCLRKHLLTGVNFRLSDPDREEIQLMIEDTIKKMLGLQRNVDEMFRKFTGKPTDAPTT